MLLNVFTLIYGLFFHMHSDNLINFWPHFPQCCHFPHLERWVCGCTEGKNSSSLCYVIFCG